MADVAITLKLTAGEFQTLREELRAHHASLRAGRKAAGEAKNFIDRDELMKREARVAELMERLG